MDSFKAFRIHEENKKIVSRFEQLKLDDLAEGDVVVRVTHSDINFKDVLAATGAGKFCVAIRWSAESTSQASSNPPPTRVTPRVIPSS